jgi:hypothetical protein
LPPYSGLKNEPNKQQTKYNQEDEWAYFLIDLLSDPEDGDRTLLRNISELLSDYTATNSRR